MELIAQTAMDMTVLTVMITAVVIDWRSRRIPNLLTFGGAFLGFVCQTGFYGMEGFLDALGGWGVGFAFLIPGYALRQTGAGDVKLLATTGTFLGPVTTLVAAISSILIGALVSLLIALFGRGASPWRRYGNMLRCLLVTGKAAYVSPNEGELMARRFPYAAAIAAGTFVALWWSSLPELVKAWSQP